MIPYDSAVFLDAGTISLLTNNNPQGEPRRIRKWFADLIGARVRIVLPEIGDYEVRRKLLHIGSTSSLDVLDWLKDVCEFLPIDSHIMLSAALLWAQHRSIGRVRTSEDRLDADAILMASVLSYQLENSILATSNVKDFDGILDARPWHEIEV